MKICEFVNSEINYIISESNFTKEQLILFNLRVKDIPLEECAERMNVSVSTVKRLNKRIKAKIDKLYM